MYNKTHGSQKENNEDKKIKHLVQASKGKLLTGALEGLADLYPLCRIPVLYVCSVGPKPLTSRHDLVFGTVLGSWNHHYALGSKTKELNGCRVISRASVGKRP